MLIKSCLLGGGVKLTIHIHEYFASRSVRQVKTLMLKNSEILLLARLNKRLQQKWTFRLAGQNTEITHLIFQGWTV